MRRTYHDLYDIGLLGSEVEKSTSTDTILNALGNGTMGAFSGAICGGALGGVIGGGTAI